MTFEQFKKSICDKDPQVKWALDLIDEEVEEALQQQREEMVKKVVVWSRNYEYDSDNHKKGMCGHSMALCSAIEQTVKLEIEKILAIINPKQTVESKK